MMASHGCGQRIGLGRFLGVAALVALGLGGGPGRADACHVRPKPAATTPRPNAGNVGATVHSQQVISPTSLVPQIPSLTATPPTITTTSATAPVPAPTPAAALAPSPVAHPPAAESIPAPTAPLDVSAWQNTAAPTCACTCPPAPPTDVPVISPPPLPPTAPPPLNPPASESIPTPEPASIVSALALIGAAAAYRRSRRAR